MRFSSISNPPYKDLVRKFSLNFKFRYFPGGWGGSGGFFKQLDFDELRAFSCPKHGNSPPWMNTDGKYVEPTKKKCCHLKELDREMNDEEVLEQSTTFKNRVFLANP